MRRKFWRHWRIFCITVLVLILIFSVVFYLFLDSYEQGRSTYLAQSVVDAINNKKFNQITEYIKRGNFTSKEYFNNLLSQKDYKDVIYEKKLGLYKDDVPVYSIKSNDEEIAVVTLKKSDKKGSFNINRWLFDSIELSISKNDITIIVPHNTEVSINGINVDNKYLKSNDYYPENINNIKNQITLDSFDEWIVNDIYEESIITLSKGNVIKYKDNEYRYDFGSNETLLNELHDYLQNLCYDYNRYVSNEHSFWAFSPYLLTNTPTYKFMYGVRNTNVWSKNHTPTEFSNFELSDMQMYNDDLFSIKAKYHYEYFVYENKRAYDADITLLMVKKNGKWLLGDLTT